MPEFPSLAPPLWAAICAVIGLCVGSFLNVVIHRVPLMMEREWEDELDAANDKPPRERAPYNLFWPRSKCPACGTAIRWWQNIPIFSFLLLQGKCQHCGTSISLRYPLVELITGLAFCTIALTQPMGWASMAWMGFAATLIALAGIDLDTYLLPDSLTLPLLWAGLLFNLITDSIPLEQAVLGAVFGYIVLWSIFHVFKLATGKEGMGYGDFKLLAAGGAWFGAASVVSVLLISSTVGILFGLLFQKLRGNALNAPFPFGPSIVFALFCALFGLDAVQWLLI